MNYDDPVQNLHIHLNKGMQHLNGDKAEQFVRFRKNNDGSGYALGDVERVKAQSLFIQATIDEVFSLVNVFKINDLVKDFSKLVKTNFSMNEMLTYAPYIFAIDRDKIMTHQLEGEGKYVGGVSYFVADDDANEKLIDEYFTPSTETVSQNELEIQQTIIGVSSEKVPVAGTKKGKSAINRFTSVDILDASDGRADAEKVRSALIKQGFNVKKIYELDGKTSFDGVTVVSKSKNPRAAAAANTAGAAEYLVNKSKNNGTDVTVILGNPDKE